MKEEDPLDLWLLFGRLPSHNQRSRRMDREVHNSLDRLRTLLDAAGPKKIDFIQSGVNPWNLRPIPPADLPAAHEVSKQVVARGGSGSTHVQEGLLNMIALTGDPASAEFWLEILDLKRPRDPSGYEARGAGIRATASCRLRLLPVLAQSEHQQACAKQQAGKRHVGRLEGTREILDHAGEIGPNPASDIPEGVYETDRAGSGSA